MDKNEKWTAQPDATLADADCWQCLILDTSPAEHVVAATFGQTAIQAIQTAAQIVREHNERAGLVDLVRRSYDIVSKNCSADFATFCVDAADAIDKASTTKVTGGELLRLLTDAEMRDLAIHENE